MNVRALDDRQRIDWLRLIRSERIGPRTFRALVSQFGSAAAAIEALPDVARRAGRGAIRIASRQEAERELAAAERLGARIVAEGEAEYPIPLRAIDTAPPILAIQGRVDALAHPMVAIVGSRNASAAGGVFAERLAADLGQAGCVIVSGLARGIDTRAHRAALTTGTVAVLAGGLDRIYPRENAALLDGIVQEGGAVLSEMPMGWEPRGRDFPRRNRIVSGLSYGVVVVEAARRSGSLITARFALEQGREVFAVPGSPLDPRAEGTNDLIRGGATLCSDARNVLDVLAPLIARRDEAAWTSDPATDGDPDDRPGFWDELTGADHTVDASSEDDRPFRDAADQLAPSDRTSWARGSDDRDVAPDGDESRILQVLGPTPISADDLCRQTGTSIRIVQRVLMELELAGRIQRHGGNAVSIVPGGFARAR